MASAGEPSVGIESDQLVYDYLSRVGDLAQQAQLPSGTRMRLVATLRNEIERQRTKFGGHSPAGVRRILGRLGTPDEVVASAATGDDAGAEAPAPDPGPRTPPGAATLAPEPGPPDGAVPRQRGWRRVPRPRKTDTPSPAPVPPVTASPPHLAGMDELGPSGSEPDWWRIDPAAMGASDGVAGFVGGVEIPEILKPPPQPSDDAESSDETEGEAEAEAGAGTEGRRRLLPRLPRAGFGSPVLLFAAALLLVGAALGSLVALGLGWLFAYASRRLSPAETKLAVFGIPGTAVTAGALWLWGRVNEQWGEAIEEDGVRDALTGTWPWVLKGAAVGSAVFLVWRARRAR
ncbi:hypothetical protein [Streptomyces peucetius]|uniref:Integral membrane protein n=1 Tax=Streptomyces peucetius TaxID=1950 RepID=A0ABY6I809_STRPE|nr:hypothetical protein [Streptomyces peucetius]UYQ62874.1 hypothetical protein OGH68_16220 [Streptomyces peucetius]